MPVTAAPLGGEWSERTPNRVAATDLLIVGYGTSEGLSIMPGLRRGRLYDSPPLSLGSSRSLRASPNMFMP